MDKSEVIFENGHYVACAMRDGSLIVQSKRKQYGRRGVRLVGESAPHWIDSIRRAVAEGDKDEANMLCRAMLT